MRPNLKSQTCLTFYQCDQIGRFIALWANFQSLWQQLICKNCVTFLGNFYKGVKIFHYSCEIILGNFYRYLATFYWSHWLRCSSLENGKVRLVLVLFCANFKFKSLPKFLRNCYLKMQFWKEKLILLSPFSTSVTRLGDYWKSLATILLTKVAPKDCWLLNYFEKDHII